MQATNQSAASPSSKPAAKKPSSKKMSIEKVDELRRAVGAGELTIAEAARREGRSETAIRRAVRGQEWHCRARSYKDATAPAVPARSGGGRPPRVAADVVRSIRAARGGDRKAIAALHGVSPRYVSKIWNGDARLDVEDLAVESPEAVQ